MATSTGHDSSPHESGSGEAPAESILLAGRYDLQERLGAGGMAEVWLARDTLLARPVAVKLLDRRLAADGTTVEQFKREAQSAAGLNHPNIVAVYDWGRVHDTYYLVMEYVPGSNLKDLVRRRGALPEATALRLVDQIGAALEAAHQHGIVHCDVKPQNVLLDAHGRPKVADFGLACALGLTQLDAADVRGSAHYVSPERADGHPVDNRADIYSLGAVLYELLTGRVPFDGDSVGEIARRHVREEVTSPRTLEPAISPLTETIVMRCLAKHPMSRFQSATDLRESIADAQGSLVAALELTQPMRAMPASSTPSSHSSGTRTAARPAHTAAWVSPLGGRRAAARPAWLVPVGALVGLVLFGSAIASYTPAAVPTTAVAGVRATPSSAPPVAMNIVNAAPAAAQSAPPTAVPPPTKPAARCGFVLGFKQLRDKAPDAVGDCLEDEHLDAQSGETVQRTTKGVFTFGKDKVTRFSDSSRTWVDGPFGLQVRANNERFRWELGQR
jgi:hypothetical protein